MRYLFFRENMHAKVCMQKNLPYNRIRYFAPTFENCALNILSLPFSYTF